ncbi:MAG: phage gp6-like head-tail connector protein [Chloroflexi bacterium]|nr:phage gp6-like head-tail connector protein [Chloroflexota bacterium]
MSYISVEELKAYLNITAAVDDMLLTTLIERAEAIWESPTMSGRVFEARTDSTRYFDSTADVEGLTLYLDKDLCAITSITNGDGTTVTAAQYVTQPRNDTPFWAITLKSSKGIVWESDSSGDSENAITIVGRWSYSTAPSSEVKHAIARLGAWLYRQKDTSADIERPFIAANGTTILPSAYPNDVTDLAFGLRRLVLR